MTVSHAVGDGVTFFQLLKQLSFFMGNDDHTSPHVPSIDWPVPTRGTHELYPPCFSPRDIDLSYGLPFFVGLIKNAILTLSKRKPTIFLIDKNAVSDKKRSMRKELNNTSISSNDVISTALCQANSGVDIFIFTENARDDASIPRNAGGNFLYEIPISREAGPLAFRTAVLQKSYYDTNQLPAQPFWCGRVGRLTSMATIAEQVVHDGIETLCTMPLTSFLDNIPMDVALIYRHNKQYLGVLHNFVELKPCELLDDIRVKDRDG